MSKEKSRVREQFRTAVFARDRHRCAIPGCKVKGDENLDAHHITPREDMPNGGYVKENGISLCSWHHLQAETVLDCPGSAGMEYLMSFSPKELYRIVGSSYEEAYRSSER